MNHNFTKRTLAGALAVLCVAGTVPGSVASNFFGGTAAVTAYADAEAASIPVATVREVATLEEFLTAANSAEDGDTIKLIDSFDLTGAYTIDNSNSFTVDFNGNTILYDSMGNRNEQSYLYLCNANTHITFLDSGHGGGMFAENPRVVRFIKVNKGTVEILSGNYKGGRDISRTESNDAHIYIKGGYFDLQADDSDGPFYRSGSGQYFLTGGYFTERTNLKKYIPSPADGFEYYDIEDPVYDFGIRKIGAVSIDPAAIESISDQEYTGSKITPDVKIQTAAGLLSENVDFTASYDENIEVGTATVYINGIGDFYGTITKTFRIKELPKYEIPKDLNAPYGSTLSNVILPEADNGTWSWDNSAENVGNVGVNYFTATFVPNDTEHYLIVHNVIVPVRVYHTYKKVGAVEPTCTEPGHTVFYKGSDGKYYADNKGIYELTLDDIIIPAKGHTFDDPAWTWSDFSTTAAVTAKATFKCKECRYGEIVDAKVTAKVVNPTYTADGKYVYTATVKFDGKTYTDTMEVAIPMLKLTYVPKVEPTCQKNGHISYWFDEVNNKYYADEYGIKEISKEQTVIQATGHNLGKLVWKWSDDYSSATLSSTCSNCNMVVGTTATIRSVTTEPTYTSAGKIVYTASAKLEGKIYTDTKEVIIPKLTFVAPEISYEQGENAVKLTWTEVKGAEKYAVASYVSGRWNMLAEVDDTSYVLDGLKAGNKYTVAVLANIGGKYITDFSNAVTVSPKGDVPEYPTVKAIEYNEEFHQFKVSWTRVKNAQNYGVAVYLAGRWVVVNQKIPAAITYYTSPKLKPGQTYKMVICAKVGGEWDTSALNSRAFTVTVK
ncbi:hypothetical protein [Ruminococcus albus]|uniref:Fibronectin type-III domain-containing protein n=1 Tax=Ruminococcus albus TaxID=1264 RepID=A0A1I1GTJ5_RUMAL|nr:hypothetical protein [Ruminococcus albus]SFC14984.1 hypothetical protein SAMN02910406_01227 [Ruminococcus albus]